MLWPPDELTVTATVFYTPEDTQTSSVLDWFGKQVAPRINWNWREQPVLELCKRSIGRNIAALATVADLVWFCDADYWFKADCWNAFTKMDAFGAPLAYPREVQTHRTHELGDNCIKRAEQTAGLISVDPDEFASRVMNRAIGGIQIVQGNTCRAQGYLRDSKAAQQPRTKPIFARNREDVWFRNQLDTGGVAIDLPGVYRIRHSRAGRHTPGIIL